MNALASRMVCTGCGTALDPDERHPFRCPAARPGDDVDHVLASEVDLRGARLGGGDELEPFVRFRTLSHVYRRARRTGLSDEAWSARVRAFDARVQALDLRGLRETPYVEAPELARELGLRAERGGGLWIKDETHNVAGSHKVRHLAGLALHLEAIDEERETRLAIASCGNAALAAAVLARAAERPLDAYVPPHAEPRVLEALEHHGARLVFCERGAADLGRGDPCFRRYREAVEDGALPFTCQGSENGLVIEGGKTLAWELVLQHLATGRGALDRIVIQVGGGALASAVVAGLRDAVALGVLERLPRVHAVQPANAHPLARAWRAVIELVARDLDASFADRDEAWIARWVKDEAPAEVIERVLALAAHERSRFMRPWETEPVSLATGILDDETYDWRAIVRALLETGGWPVLASEASLARAQELGCATAGIDVSATGSAGLAGCLELARAQSFAAHDGRERVAVLFTGALG